MDDIIISETGLARIKPAYGDLDKEDQNKLKVSFGSPFNSNGEWKTGFKDAGSYLIPVTIADGDLAITKEVKVFIKNKNRIPVIENLMNINVKEGESVKIKPNVTDLDKELVKVSISDPVGDDGIWTTGFSDAGDYTITVTADDGFDKVTKDVSVKVTDVNRKPVIEKIADIIVTETETVNLKVKATDPDGDNLNITYSEPFNVNGQWKTTYDSAGKYPVKVTVSDGKLNSVQNFTLTVNNKNRPPVVHGII